MCETMANIPVEEKSSYVLTEDMIDAAMNEQFILQEDLESEGELSSSEDSIDQESQESHTNNEIPSATENDGFITNPNTETVAKTGPTNLPTANNNKMSVLVIETGLDKNGDCYTKSAKETLITKETPGASSAETFSNNAVDVNSHINSDVGKAVDSDDRDNKSGLKILQSILSNDKDKNGIIDLCDSDVEDFSEEDDVNEAEDDELKSVMETNLMAEIGLPVKKKTGTESSGMFVEKTSESVVTPRISVKDIAQISTNPFNRSPPSNLVIGENPVLNNKTNENQGVKNSLFALRSPNINPTIPVNGNNQGHRPIHINKIAVPHSTFLNHQGQTMKCVYVKSTTSLPFIINTPTQTTAANANLKYVFTKPVKKGPIQTPAITALKNLTKSVQPQRLMLQKNTKVVAVARKLEKPLELKNAPSVAGKRENHLKYMNIIMNNTLIRYRGNKSYVPPDTFPESPVYTCLECNDKFLFNSSLMNHKQRYSLNISYRCKFCRSELQFFNRCALSSHLRGHKMSIEQVDSSCITFNTIPKGIIDKGIIQTYFKNSETSTSQPVQSTSCLNSKSINTNASSGTGTQWKSVSVMSSNLSNNKITTIAGQSKSVCYQTTSSSDVRPVTSAVANSQPKSKYLPLILPKTTNPVNAVTLLGAQSVQNHVKDQSTGSNKAPQKGLIVFCKPLPQPQNAQQCAIVANSIPPNIVCEADTTRNTSPTVSKDDSEMIVDDDVSIVPNNTEEEEEIVDVENVDGNVTCATSITSVFKSESEKSLVGQKKRNYCNECGKHCPVSNISRHLNGAGRPLQSSNMDLVCKICNLILPTRCALKIHLRIHLKITPYQCPDCGKDFTTWDELYAHLKFSCGHFAKCIRYICKGCKAHFPKQTGLAEHIVNTHAKDIFKCSSCPVAFYKNSSLIKHINTEHPNEKNKSKLELHYKQCEMCPKKLLPEESYLVHAKEHTNSMIYGYKCSMCSIVYASKMAFIIHQIKEKSSKDLSDKLENQGKNCSNENQSVEEPVQVSDSNSDYEDEPVIIRKYPDLNNGILTDEKDPLSLDDWECTQEQKVNEKTEEVCIVCKKNSVVLLPGIDLNRQSLCCKQCVKPIDDDETTGINKGSRNIVSSGSKARNNKRSKPKSVYRSASTDTVKTVSKKRRISDISQNSSPENENTFEALAVSPSRKKNRKKKEKIDPKCQTHIQGQVIKSRSLDELCHKCSKCEFVTEKRESFLEHITIHRSDPNTYQCLECGLCFVVLPSLERHLHMHHSIKDVSNYTENNKASLPQKPVQVEVEKENQCRVCYEVFDCKSSLDKHFRIHGMAFMSRLSKSP